MKSPTRRLLLAFLAALGTWAASAQAGTETPKAARLFLSWHRPYGMPGATNNLTLAPGDTTQQDTLYLSFIPGSDASGLIATTGLLKIRPAAGDTLGAYWQFGRGILSPHKVDVICAPDSASPFLAPWKKSPVGVRAVSYDPWSESGDLVLVIAIPSSMADSMRSGGQYVLARLLFRQPPAGIAASGQPVCVEWTYARLNLSDHRDLLIERGDRFVSWNSPGCAVCGPHRGPLAPEAWKPKSPR